MALTTRKKKTEQANTKPDRVVQRKSRRARHRVERTWKIIGRTNWPSTNTVSTKNEMKNTKYLEQDAKEMRKRKGDAQSGAKQESQNAC